MTAWRVAVAIAILLAGCVPAGTPSASTSPSPRPAASIGAASECAALNPLLDAAIATQRHVDAGIAFPEYSDEVVALDTAYRQLDLGALRAAGSRCVDVGVLLEAAHNAHARALAAWTACVEASGNSPDCAHRVVDPLWREAAASLAAAARALGR